MSTKGPTRQEALLFILSERCKLEAEQSPILIDARRQDTRRAAWDDQPEQKMLNQSPGGRAVGRIIAQSSMPEHERAEILAIAAKKFISTNGGEVEIVISPGDRIRQEFVSAELPAILANTKFTTLNEVPREKLAALYVGDSVNNHQVALPQILTALQNRVLVNATHTVMKSQHIPEWQRLQENIERIVGPKLTELSERIKRAEVALYREVLIWQGFAAEREALGIRKYLLPSMIAEKFRHRRSLREARLELTGAVDVRKAYEREILSPKYADRLAVELQTAGFELNTPRVPGGAQRLKDAIQSVVNAHRHKSETTQPTPKQILKPVTRQKL